MEILNNTCQVVRSGRFISIVELEPFSQQLNHTRKERSFSDNIDATPFSVKLTKSLGEEAVDRVFFLNCNEQRTHGLDGAASAHTKLRFLASSYCHGHKFLCLATLI